MTNTQKTVNITGQQESSNQATVKHCAVTGTGVIGMAGDESIGKNNREISVYT